jgi:glycine hydroxymethyltransferase
MAGKFYSTIQLNSFIAVSITLLEMMRYGEEYAKQVILNATSLDRYLSSLGIETRNHEGEKRNHQVHIFIDQKDRRKVYKKLLENGISTNLAKLGDNRDFIRIGTQEVTRRGMKDSEMKIIADLINTSLSDKNIGEEVLLFNQKFNKIGYSFDDK